MDRRQVRRVMLSAALAAVVSVAVTTTGVLGAEASVTVPVESEPPVAFRFGFSPATLPAGGKEVTRLELELGETSPVSRNGLSIGITRTQISLDRTIVLEPRGLPVCPRSVAEGEYELDGQAPAQCRRAVVGNVAAQAFVAYPESEGVRVRQEGTIYNGGARGRLIRLLIEVPLEENVGGVLWMVAKVRPIVEAEKGSEMTIDVPPVAEGSGDLIGLSINLGRALRRDGRRLGYVEARCHGGRLAAQESTTLSNGLKSRITVVRTCRTRP